MNILWKSFVLFQKKIRDEKIMLFEDLYTEFSKLKLTKFYSAKTNTLYHGKSFSKDNFEEMIKVAMTRKYKTLKKRKRNLNVNYKKQSGLKQNKIGSINIYTINII